ncbi:MAG: MurR/RpiR family transcriptional regulator [Clostridia bacterium]|nr:MurR/RpiR family transcriptional regulator [Clostridia bacterium]
MNGDLIQLLEERMPTFSKGQKLIAQYLINSYDKAAYMTAARLGALVGVSESTVVRFAIELGFEGYPELQKSLQEIIRTRLTYNQRIAVTNNRIGDGDLLDKVLLSDSEKIRSTLDAISREDFHRAVDRIIGARQIFIMGVRSSASLASFLSYSLNLIFDNIRLVHTTSGSEVFESLFPMTKDDVLIAISFPRYSTRIVNAVEYAHQIGAGVIALTDNRKSPIAEHASEVLVAQSDMASYIDSLVAPLSVINAITVAIGRKKQSEIEERFDKLETLWEEFDVYQKHK